MASTRLTNAMRDTFIEQVMNGIPVNHPFNIEDVKEKVVKLIESRLPDEIKNFARKYPDLVYRKKYLYLPESLNRSNGRQVSVQVLEHENCEMVDCSAFAMQKRNHEDEQQNRALIKSQLYSATYACTTVEKLKTAFPELESYMPKQNDRYLPVATPTDVVVSNLMSAGLKVPKD